MPKYPVRFIHLQLSDPVGNQALLKPVGQAPGLRRALSSAQHRTPARQTIIRPDVPPHVVLKQEIPMAALLPQSENTLPAVPEFVTSPKHVPAVPQDAPALPQMKQAVAADLIAIPNLPMRPPDLLVIPPANQVGSPVLATSRLDSRLLTLGTQASGDGAESQSAASDGALSGSGTHGTSDPVDTAASQSAASTEPRLQGSADPTNLVRITQPKNGKFGIIVSGTSASDLLPEGVEALNGKMLYTVYIRVGLRRNWILQYCLPNDAEPGEGAIEAPWPILMLRPDPLSASDLDYIVVHGIINCNGRFEQLGLVYPRELTEQEKLLGALRQWVFRPASRTGQAVSVEALLVIPRQSE